MPMREVRVTIRGRVQGVGFRHFIRKKAISEGTCGWVKNLPDGKVEAVFQGERKDLENMIKWCRKGPPRAIVEWVDTAWKDPVEHYPSFDIVF